MVNLAVCRHGFPLPCVRLRLGEEGSIPLALRWLERPFHHAQGQEREPVTVTGALSASWKATRFRSRDAEWNTGVLAPDRGLELGEAHACDRGGGGRILPFRLHQEGGAGHPREIARELGPDVVKRKASKYRLVADGEK